MEKQETTKPKIEVTCPHCGWVTKTRSRRLIISCSSCRSALKNKDVEIKKEVTP